LDWLAFAVILLLLIIIMMMETVAASSALMVEQAEFAAIQLLRNDKSRV
jgi:hypothetical protein